MTKKLCNIITAGDVDSGKSTLLGRLLYNTGNIYEDQLDDMKRASEKYSADGRLEYGLLFDGLLEERRQQITIDIAHRFFNIRDTRFHLFDCPGHQQYTSNFVIAAAEAQIAILVVDSTKGLMPQTFVHYNICKLFRLKKVIFVITKIDLSTPSDVSKLQKEIQEHFSDVNPDILQTSAIENTNMDNFAEYIYNVSREITDAETDKFALCVQSVKLINRIRYIQGISFGTYRPTEMYVYPSNIKCRLTPVPDGVDVYTMAENIDISRGFIISDVPMSQDTKINGNFINFSSDNDLSDLIFKYGTQTYKIKNITSTSMELEQPINFCNIQDFKQLGFGIIIDNKSKLNIGIFIINSNKKQAKNKCYWFTGLSGSGKSTLANKFKDYFPIKPVILDGDEIRQTINYDLTLSQQDRDTNVKKIANLANLLLAQGFNVIVACISKDAHQREYAKQLMGDSYIEIFVESNSQTRKNRDTKGLYKNNIVPLSNYEPSNYSYITINTDSETADQSYARLINALEQE